MPGSSRDLHSVRTPSPQAPVIVVLRRHGARPALGDGRVPACRQQKAGTCKSLPLRRMSDRAAGRSPSTNTPGPGRCRGSAVGPRGSGATPGPGAVDGHSRPGPGAGAGVPGGSGAASHSQIRGPASDAISSETATARRSARLTGPSPRRAACGRTPGHAPWRRSATRSAGCAPTRQAGRPRRARSHRPRRMRNWLRRR
jgi:hypothetical protein